ncbi:hypothetical protein Lalb_Chr06g0170671 [Lupinus albus]|uniref:Uncharacterized protein n=1 Tax=Lupinus albus TaxID=3870 RepID=A0A6A4QG62_LUPAL|nr:hypothetical protein Lalb_Chr06g0170671 [Lupinus albus]
MKISKLFCFQRFDKKMRVSSTVILGGNVQRRVPFGFSYASIVLRNVYCKLKNHWKQVLGWKKKNPQSQYSYDIHSYCLNFDDAPSKYHIPSHVC